MNLLQAELRASNALYIESHPEVRATLNDLMSAVLVSKPDVSHALLVPTPADYSPLSLSHTHMQQDIYDFASKHFSKSNHIPKDKLLRPLVICGPSGVGKGTLMNMLFEAFPEDFGFSVSHVSYSH